jgi:hypothetical protein
MFRPVSVMRSSPHWMGAAVAACESLERSCCHAVQGVGPTRPILEKAAQSAHFEREYNMSRKGGNHGQTI